MRRLTTVAAAVLCAAAAPLAQSITSSATLASQYEFRGAHLTTSPVVQPEVHLTAGPVSAAVWASAALTDRTHYGSADEVDVVLSYAAPAFAGIGVVTGAVAYVLPNQPAFSAAEHVTAEVFASVALPLPLHPHLSLYYDFVHGDGFYAEAAAAQHVGLAGIGFEVEGVVGYDAGQFGADPTFSHAAVGVAKELHLRGLHVVPFVHHTWSLRHHGEGAWTFGLTLAR
jgi:hypothetical protein